MSFWSGETLEIRLPGLIEGFSRDQIDCAAYTLRVGSEVFISPSTAVEAATKTKLLLKEDEGFAIPPGQFALVLTEESVEVPKSAVAFISMKARIKFKGLVNVSGFHVDPGYHGKLLFAIYNANASPVHLARGDDAFLIWYASLDVESETYSRRASSFSGLPSELITPISGPLRSLEGLSDRMGKLEGEQQAVRVGVGIASTLFVALIALVLTLLGQTCSSSADLSSASGISQPGDAAAPVDPGLESSSGESPSVTFPSTEGAQPTPQEAR